MLFQAQYTGTYAPGGGPGQRPERDQGTESLDFHWGECAVVFGVIRAKNDLAAVQRRPTGKSQSLAYEAGGPTSC